MRLGEIDLLAPAQRYVDWQPSWFGVYIGRTNEQPFVLTVIFRFGRRKTDHA